MHKQPSKKEPDIGKSYKTLELERDASLDDVRKAYKDMVRVWHPDRFTGNARLRARANEKLKAINLAYGEIQKFLERELLIRPKRENLKNSSHSSNEIIGLRIRRIIGSSFSHFHAILLNFRFKEYYSKLMSSNISGTKNAGRSSKRHSTKLRGSLNRKDRSHLRRKRFSEVMDEIVQAKRVERNIEE